MADTMLDPILSRATADVLEKMFFTGYTDESSQPPDQRDKAIVVALTFQGERCGTLTLAIATSAARSLTADFLGVDADQSSDEVQVTEVIKELANMICGDALSSLEHTPLLLSPPRLVAPGEVIHSPGACSRSFDLDQGWLTVTLDLREIE